MEPPLETVAGRYRVDEVVGRGGMGIVYRATDVRHERIVALKLIAPELAQDPSFRTRFLREVKSVLSINHPNVIPVYNAGVEDGDLFIAMQYVEGTDLRAMIYHDGALPPERATAIVARVAGALEAAHEKGLVHRDVKPANVLIADPGGLDHVYLTDFGLSKHTTSAPGLTQTGHVVGTADYVAPEQIRGEDLDKRADIYALGCVLFHALTGQPPFPRESDAAKLWAHMYDAAPSVREVDRSVPSGFDEVLSRALEKDPAARYQSARELGEAVTAALQPPTETLPGRQIAPAAHDAEATPSSEEPPDAAVAPPPSAPMADPPTAPPQPPARAAGDAPPPPSPPPAGPSTGPEDPQSPTRERRILVALAAVGLVVIAAAAALLAGVGDDDGPGSEQAAVPVAPELPANLEWQGGDKLPFRRQYAASTTVDGKIWIIGGIRTKSSSTSTQIYDPASGSWSPGPGLPYALHHSAAVNYGGKAVVIGGFIPGDELTTHQSDRVYALSEGSVEELPALKYKRGAPAAAVVGDKIIVVGGQADGKLVPQTEVYDGEKWTEAAGILTPREHLGAASDDRYLYAVGGRNMSSGANSTAFERYDPVSNEWAKLESMPENMGSVGVGYARGRIVAVGGEDPNKAFDDVQGYNIRGRQWEKLPALPTPSHGVAVTALEDSLYAIGGATLAGHTAPTNDVEVLDLSGRAIPLPPKNVEWREADDPPSAVQYAATAEVGDRIWLFGGLDEDEKVTDESVAYDRNINTWTAATPLPGPVHHAAAVDYRGDPVVIGGVPAGGGPASGSDRVYVLRNGEWESLGRLNHERWAAGAAVVGDKIVVVGGRDGERLVAETEVYDNGQWTVARNIPTPRDHLGAASDGDYVYAVGGRRVSADENLRALERYDPAANTWTKLDPMPKNTGSVGVAFVAGRIVAVGGEPSTTTVSNAVQAYDVSRQRWSPLDELPEARHGVAVAALRGSLFAIGGAAAAGHVKSTADAHVLKFE